MRRTDIRDDVLWLQQSKTGKKLRISIEGELKQVVERCVTRAKSYPVASLHLVVSTKGQPVGQWNLRRMFDEARAKAKVGDCQFRDIRVKTGTDVNDLKRAQALLGHENRAMTEHYIRNRIGEKVKPLR